MIIKTQDRRILINFDSLSSIERIGHKIRCYFQDTLCPQLLGDYPTDKRAQEVLDELYECFSWDLKAEIRGDGYTNQNVYYDMPKTIYSMPKE